MAGQRDALRDWHRLFGLVLTDFFTGSPFVVEVERDLSVQQQLLDVVIVRRGRGRIVDQLPDGLEGLTAHNLITFKSHHEALDGWAMKELVGHHVAYRKLVSNSPSDLLPENEFGLYAVTARFPQNLSGQVPWKRIQAGAYDCKWGTDTIRVIVAGELSREAQNAPFHLFSASPELVGFGSSAYRQRTEDTSALIKQLFERFQREGFAMTFTMEDFQRQYAKEHFSRLTPKEQQEALEKLPAEDREKLLASLLPEEHRKNLQALPADKLLKLLSAEQIQQLREQLSRERPTPRRKPPRKK